MRVAGLRARGRRRFVVTTNSRHNFAIAPNRLRRRFRPRRMNRVWAADMTACRLQHGWCYLAVVLDLASRRVIGWAVGRVPAPDLALAALRPAIGRVPRHAALLHHSDRGIPYASDRFRAFLTRHRITPSMSRTGDCWDNAPVESFFSSFKTEASPDRPWLDLHAATSAIEEYVHFYNHRRLHSTLNYQSPAAFEERLAVTV